MPPKVYEADHEKDAHGDFTGHLMSENDRAVNDALAHALFVNWLKGAAGKTLDVGSKYPYLAHCLKKRGCNAYGMDNISIVPEYARELDVPMLLADFEAITEKQIQTWVGGVGEKFKLITLVHVFEHMYQPLEALQKLRRLLADDGVLFIRLPDHGVRGFERDLTPGHYTIHPFFHTLSSVLELLVQARDLFIVAETYALEGSGQRDFLLRPITKKPTVFAGLIAKNEERDIAKCLASIQDVVDSVVLVDTGSTDQTLAAAQDACQKPLFTSVYLEASRQDEHGDWKLWDFSKARNQFVQEIERLGSDYLLWMDADDELCSPAELRRAIYWQQYQVFSIQIENGGSSWPHHRLWRTGLGIHYEGRCHEYPTIGGFPTIELKGPRIHHDAEPGAGEDSNARNLRILQEEFAEKPTPRTAFYLANTHKDGNRYTQAIPFYAQRIAMGVGFRDEWLFAHLYKARCERWSGDVLAAENTLLRALSEQRDWAEFWMELAYMAQDQGRHRHAIGFALQAHQRPIPPSELWREPNKYTDQPARIISWSYEHLGDIPQALSWALQAEQLIGCEDEDWQARITRLRSRMAEITNTTSSTISSSSKSLNGNRLVPATPKIALHRPGAIGDVLMTLNLIPALRTKWPGHEIHYFCHSTIGNALIDVMSAAGVDVIHEPSALQRNEYVRTFDLIGYPLHEGYPEKQMRKHLLHYFADELEIETGSALPSLRLNKPELSRDLRMPLRYATLHVKTGWSAYKNWPVERWADVLKNFPKMPVYQIGAKDEPRIPGACHDFMGSIPMTLALLANASLHLGLDSFPNHLTHYQWGEDESTARQIPAVILFGSTQANASGYPHNTNISLGLHCQPCFREDPQISQSPRGVCVNPSGQTYDVPMHACMNGISVAMVAREIAKLWHGTSTHRSSRLSIVQNESPTESEIP